MRLLYASAKLFLEVVSHQFLGCFLRLAFQRSRLFAIPVSRCIQTPVLLIDLNTPNRLACRIHPNTSNVLPESFRTAFPDLMTVAITLPSGSPSAKDTRHQKSGIVVEGGDGDPGCETKARRHLRRPARANPRRHDRGRPREVTSYFQAVTLPGQRQHHHRLLLQGGPTPDPGTGRVSACDGLGSWCGGGAVRKTNRLESMLRRNTEDVADRC